MGLIQTPTALGHNARFAALFESTPGTYNPPTANDFFKALAMDLAHTLSHEMRDDANEGLDPYESIAGRGDLSWTVEKYFAAAAAGTAPPEGVFLRALFCGTPVVDSGVSVSYPLLNADPATAYRALTLQRYSNADDVFFSRALTGCMVNEGKFSWSGSDKPKMAFSGKATGIIEAGYTTTSGSGTSATVDLASGTGRRYDVGARINVGADTNLTVATQAANSVTLGGSITFANAEVVAPYCPTPSYTAAPVLGLTQGTLTYNGTALTDVTSWEINVSRGLSYYEDGYGSTYATDADRGMRVISGKFGIRASRSMLNDLIRRRQFAEVALAIRVGSSTGRNHLITLGQILPQIEKDTLPASGAGTLEVPFIALASTEGAVDALTWVVS
jgi:hypothetical protein